MEAGTKSKAGSGGRKGKIKLMNQVQVGVMFTLKVCVCVGFVFCERREKIED